MFTPWHAAYSRSACRARYTRDVLSRVSPFDAQRCTVRTERISGAESKSKRRSALTRSFMTTLNSGGYDGLKTLKAKMRKDQGQHNVYSAEPPQGVRSHGRKPDRAERYILGMTRSRLNTHCSWQPSTTGEVNG